MTRENLKYHISMHCYTDIHSLHDFLDLADQNPNISYFTKKHCLFFSTRTFLLYFCMITVAKLLIQLNKY